MKPKQFWRKVSGFESRMCEFVAKFDGYVLRVGRMQRVNEVWRKSPFWHAYLDWDWIGYATSKEGAQMAAVLMVSE